MPNETQVLMLTAISIGFLHTILGPDHYLPFIVMARARRWSVAWTGLVTFLCGLGHILGSVTIGLVGIALGIAVGRLEAVESFRAPIAAWGLIGLGLAYFAWGLRHALRNRPHRHVHSHREGKGHSHPHTHRETHSHAHIEGGKASITPWVLFTIFVLGPCEPLIPILMYPAAKNSISGVVLVTAAFGITTILTMLAAVVAVSWGASFLPLGRLERYSHAMAGGVILLSGAAIQFLGL